MATTLPGDLFQSQVFTDYIRRYRNATPALYGSPYVIEREVVDWGSGGSTITVPTVTSKLTASDLPLTQAEIDAGVVSQKLVMSHKTVPVISKVVPFETTYSALEDVVQRESARFAFEEEVSAQVGEAQRQSADASLIARALTSTLEVACDGTIDERGIALAKAKWGDRLQRDAALVVHSKVYTDLLLLNSVRSAYNFGVPTLPTGAISSIMGMPVYISDNIPVEGGVYRNLLVARGGLWIAFKRDLTARVVELPGDRRLIEFTFRYAVDLNTVDNADGAVLLLCTSSLDS
jgi:hypothetical protein